jgi:hypothetical protein
MKKLVMTSEAIMFSRSKITILESLAHLENCR